MELNNVCHLVVEKSPLNIQEIGREFFLFPLLLSGITRRGQFDQFPLYQLYAVPWVSRGKLFQVYSSLNALRICLSYLMHQPKANSLMSE